MSTTYCVEPPTLGPTSNVTSSGNTSASWMLESAEYTCNEPGKYQAENMIYLIIIFFIDSYFYLKERDFDDTFSVKCEKEIIFGKKFPYWKIGKIGGIEYPDITECPCLNALECNDEQDLGEEIANSFDKVSNKIDDNFEYFCDMNGARGKL